MKWELHQPKDKYYVPVITIKWLVIMHAVLLAVISTLAYFAWYS